MRFIFPPLKGDFAPGHSKDREQGLVGPEAGNLFACQASESSSTHGRGRKAPFFSC